MLEILMNLKSLLTLLTLLTFTLPSQALMKITGAGASFPYPIYSKWFSEYAKQNPGVQFNYSAIGSGGGVRQILKQTVDFGASDAPMKNKQLKKAKFPIKHIPTVLGAVAVAYNVEGIEKGLKMSGEVLSKIFMGKIRKWNHSELQKLNPTLNVCIMCFTILVSLLKYRR